MRSIWRKHISFTLNKSKSIKSSGKSLPVENDKKNVTCNPFWWHSLFVRYRIQFISIPKFSLSGLKGDFVESDIFVSQGTFKTGNKIDAI